jgi:diguanylate cyclase (GGDEF)-like protein/PAS domain S-box-containing protein
MRIQAEANLSALIESTEDLIWSVDPRLRLITFNRAFKEYFDRNFGGPVAPGMSVRELHPPALAVFWLQLYERSLSGKTFSTEHTIVDGRTLEISFSPIVVDGETTGVSVFGKDITERKKAESALRKAEADLTALIESTQDLIWSVDLNFRLTTFNNALREHFEKNYRGSLQLGMCAEELVEPERRQLMPTLYRRALAEGTFRTEFGLSDGRILEMAFNPIIVDGKTTGVSVFGKDITERRAAEKKYQDIFDGALEGFFLTTPEGKAITANRALAEMLGYDSPQELVARITDTAHDLWADPEERASFARQIEEQGFVRGRECRFKRKDGSTLWIMLNCRCMRNAKGELICFEGSIQDITERKQAEQRLAKVAEELRVSEERYRAAFQMNLDSIDICHLEDGKFVDVNNAFLHTLGFERDEVIGHTAKELGIWENPADRQKMLEVVRLNSFCHNLEAPYRTKDGTLRWGLLSVSPIEMNGVPSILSVTRDITDAKAAKDLLTAAAEALRLSEERYRTVFQTCPDAVMISQRSDGVILDANQTFLDLTGYERNELVGHTTTELGIWGSAGDRQKLVDELLHNTEFRDFEVQFRGKNRETFWVRLNASMIEIGGTRCMLAFAQDISAAKEAKDLLTAAAEALRLSEERYRTAFQTSLDAINITRMDDGKFVDCNQALLDVLGYEREELIGKTTLQLGVWADTRDRTTMTNQVRQNGSCRGLEVQFKKKNGELFWGVTSASAMEVDGVPCILSITRDLSDVKAAQSEIRSLAYYDPLTGLPNRRLLMERLRQTLAAGGPDGRLRALLFVELDNFKMLNETIGHLTGDLLLMEVARRIVTCTREADIASRFGGDEFALLLEDLSEIAEDAAAQAKTVAEKIQDSIGLPFLLAGRECLTTASIGITVFGTDREGISELIQEADIALYQATSAGRNTIRFFSPALQTAVNARATLEEDLRQAIKAMQFLLYYQPQVARGRLVGAEALIRWQHPTRGLVRPDEFIPLAEETGLILPLGDWVLESACVQLAAWAGRKQSAHLSLAVNISALQFRQPGFVATVLSALERSGANPKNLKLELTESMLVENIEEVIAKMTELKKHGVSFALDDFGTGYSSLAYLKRLPLGLLKIDRAFVRDMLVDVTSGAIAQTIISLGRAMGLSVIAEGVESEEQRGFLAGLGCHTFQGFLFSPPLPLEQFEALLLL